MDRVLHGAGSVIPQFLTHTATSSPLHSAVPLQGQVAIVCVENQNITV